jgi:hypothetical protein
VFSLLFLVGWFASGGDAPDYAAVDQEWTEWADDNKWSSSSSRERTESAPGAIRTPSVRNGISPQKSASGISTFSRLRKPSKHPAYAACRSNPSIESIGEGPGGGVHFAGACACFRRGGVGVSGISVLRLD